MSHFTLGAEGLAAVENRDWPTAIAKLTEALEQVPSPAWLVARAKAYTITGDFARALDDAEHAYHRALARSNREAMTEAQYRRAVCFFRLKQYANADASLLWAHNLASGQSVSVDPTVGLVGSDGSYDVAQAEANLNDNFKNTAELQSSVLKQIWTLRYQVVKALSTAAADDVAARTLTAKMTPEKPADYDKAKDRVGPQSDSDSEEEGGANRKKTVLEMLEMTRTRPSPEQSRAAAVYEQVKFDMYQNSDTVTATLFVKGINKERFFVEFSFDTVELGPILRSDGTEGIVRMTPYSMIDPTQSKHSISSVKVELKLRKAVEGHRWPRLLFDSDRSFLEVEGREPNADALIDRFEQLNPGIGDLAQTPSTPGQRSELMMDVSDDSSWADTPPRTAQDKQRAEAHKTSKMRALAFAMHGEQLREEQGIAEPVAVDVEMQQKAEARAKAEAEANPQSGDKGKGKAVDLEPDTSENPATKTTATAPKPKAAAGPPAYPSSAKTGAKNWDKIGDDEDDEDGDSKDANHFFKLLYKNATPEQQRAMMKSYVESNGTSLSTNWDDVKGRTVETVPPEGVEAKKWEQ